MSGLAESPNYSPTQFNLPVVIAALVITFLFTMLMLTFYICSAFHHSRGLGLDANLQNTTQLGPLERLDGSVLKSLPVFVYSKSKDSKGGPLECAICLSEFEEEEKGRKLKCGHSFHVGCIDMWFDSHSNCPVCRFKVDSKEAAADNLNRVESDSRSSQSITIHIQDLAAPSGSESFKLEASPSALRDLRRFLSSSRRISLTVPVPEDPPHV